MKMLFSRGIFSCNGIDTHEGLICFCHFNTDDNKETVRLAMEAIKCRRTKVKKQDILEKVILIPFSCLDEEVHTMDYDSASLLFRKLSDLTSEPKVVVPFITTNKFHMDLCANPYTKFISI